MAGLTYFTIRKSLFGRLLGISSTGGLVMGVSSTGGGLSGPGSSDVAIAAQMWGPGMVQTIAGGATDTVFKNSGITFLSTGSTATANYFIAAPVKGVSKLILIQTSATDVTLQTTATTILLQTSTLDYAAAIGTTILKLTNSATSIYSWLELVGLSTTQWVAVGKGVGISS